MTKADIYLSIRNKATRLPGKVLLEVKGKSLTEHLISRLKKSQKFSQIILCTSTNQNDDNLVEIAKEYNIEYFRGSEDDKLDRYLKASEEFESDLIVVVDGDDIFCDHHEIDRCIEHFDKTNADYITEPNLPLGTSPFCIKKSALEIVCKNKDKKNTEVWGSFFTENKNFKIEFLEPEEKELARPEFRLTLDYKEDFELIKKIFDEFYDKKEYFSLKDIVRFLDSNPKLLEINKGVQEKYLKNLEKSKSL